MANDTASLFQTVLSVAATASTEITRYPNSFIDSILWDYNPELQAKAGATIDIVIPVVDEADVVDSQGAPFTPTDTKHSTASITLDKDYTSSFVIRNFDQARTPYDLKNYIKPRLEAVVRKTNRTIAEQVTATNFATYTTISGAGADTFARADLAGAWKNLAGRGVPVDAAMDMSFITSAVAFGNMLADTNFAQESIVGAEAATQAYQHARLMNLLGAKPLYDMHLAKFNAGKEPGILMHRGAIAGVSITPISGNEFKTVVFPKPNLPVLIEVSYEAQLRGYLVGLTCIWGVKVVRSEFGSLVETA